MTDLGFSPRFDVDAELPSPGELGRVHVIAIGGAGMSAVARLLLSAGVPVTGSDANDSPLLDELRAAGATVWVGHDAAHVAEADTLVISSAVREDNVELAEARRRGLRVLHRSQGLAVAMGDRHRVAIAGANGKTTTSSLLTVALLEAGEEPSFALGGELSAQGTNAALGAGDAFVAEADESDGSFLVYHPHVAVVTNVQPDHLDFYGDYATVERAYLAFARTVEPGGLLVACADDAGSARLAERARMDGLRVITYGFDATAHVRLGEPVLDGLTAEAALSWPAADDTRHESRLRLTVPGRHNLLNATAAFAAAVVGLGVEAHAVLDGLTAFGGTRRRFETRGVVGGVSVVDDYAHNVGKVEAVVRTAKEIAGEHALRVVFQPHLYSRTRDFAEGFAAGLAPADDIVLLDIYGAREEPMDGVTSELVAAPLRAAGRSAVVLSAAEAVEHLVAAARPGDVVMTVGAGDVTRLAGDIVEGLRVREGETS